MLLIVPVLFLWMHVSQLKQFPQFLLLQEGENFTTYCNSSTIFNNIQWYKQSPGGSPVLLMKLVKSGDVLKQERLRARFGETRKDSSLHIVGAQTADEGTYFCAGAQCSQNTCSLSPNLAVGLQEQLLLISPQSKSQKILKSQSMKK
uniref:Ig-like domain-containing protein n=1 Tax=Rhinolophus ferrumequinum TaxID=59479 RepID=A0A671FXG5_RHIFE